MSKNNQFNKIAIPVDLTNEEAEGLSLISGKREGFDPQWYEQETEGQLLVDVAQTPEELIIVSAMAGTPPDKIELHLHNDLLTIRGHRNSPMPAEANYFYHECYWGSFSRTIVLPADVRCELAQAQYRHGTLVIKLPKKNISEEIPILVVEE